MLHTGRVNAYPEVHFDHLSLEHGLAQSAVQDMAGDDLGYLWVATQYGLSRYDGYGFRNFRHQPDNHASLSDSRIKVLLKGRDGQLWVGTRNGLDRIDPASLHIERIPVREVGADSASGREYNVTDMVEDGAGNLIVQVTGGLLVLESGSASLMHVERDAIGQSHETGRLAVDHSGQPWFYNAEGLWRIQTDDLALRRVAEFDISSEIARRSSIAVLPDGMLALASRSGITLFDPKRDTVAGHIRPTDHGHADDWVGAVAADPRGMLWAMTREALVQFDPEKSRWDVRFVRWGSESARDHLVYGLDVIQDNRGYVWVGFPEGVGLSAPDGDGFRVFRHDPADPGSLTPSPANALNKVYQDDFGVVWVGGGLGGLSRFAPQSARFELIRDREVDGYFGSDNVVRSVLEQRAGNREWLWTGLSHGGIRVWERRENQFSVVADRLHSLAEPDKRLPDNRVWSLAEDPVSGHVWAGTDRGIAVVSGRAREVLAVHPVGEDGRDRPVNALRFSDDGEELWVGAGTWLPKFRLEPDRVGLRLLEEIDLSATDGGRERGWSRIQSFLERDDGSMLVATRRGIVSLNPDSGDLDWHDPAGVPGRQPRNHVFHLAEFPEGVLWVGTEQAGLGRARLENGQISEWSWLDESDGLPDRTVYALIADGSGYLWFSSNRGLARLNPDSGQVRRFTLGDGLQGLEFNNTVVTRGESGRIYFGGINGVNAFRPGDIELHPEPPRIYLERVLLAGEPLEVDGRVPVSVSAEYDRNSLVLEFVGLHFTQPESNRYAYRLEGADESWVETNGSRIVRYPDLAPGDYRFSVRAANSDGVWSEQRHLLSLAVASPPWLAPWAWALYALVAVSLVSLFIAAERRRRRNLEWMVAERTRELREQKRLVDRQASDLAELLQARTTLFANISHEFRTPLTLIEASLDRLAEKGEDAGAVITARRYLRRLLRLVDQLLSLSRLQSARDQKVPEPWPIDRVVTMTVDTFRPLAEQKEIDLACEVDGRWLTQCQQADVERILLNLIGNSLKYCPSGSKVRVAVEGADDGVRLSVSDNGPGIDSEQQAVIFERFSRMPAHEQGRIEGAGIGLTLVREAARANGGKVDLVSQAGQGASFRVWLPAWRGHMEGAPVQQLTEQRLLMELENLSSEPDLSGAENTDPPVEGPGRLGTALVVEDNDDLRQHLAQLLSDDWAVIEAGDGQRALALARERMPDIVVSDIMMPRLDGLEMLRRLREDVRTSHLPVLLLTARQDEATRLQGYSLSADDFLAKPFNPAELRLRLRRMVDLRERVQQRQWRELAATGVTPAKEQASSSGDGLPDLSERDARFLEKVRDWLEQNYDNPDASVSELAAFVSMEARTLQRKLRALTGRTPAAQLQSFRLERARPMLVDSDQPIQDISLSCGFSSPQYFTRVFSQHFGMSPSMWRKRQRQSS
ncbi:response regulator [Wenzhouxiangella sp. XN201]|uniref:hybrid sensor histidine kinase/response regulator transcription factor n=1 Tax=Wenzhouxiangella sp. XN201 TaxID=2710755 RepID=UPI0013C60CC4|nr:hybrid sensor histidine kinase/response regulator transcription factor [Wenzhouxiangella sp. XN201]NEZ04777.1 response regulator [Wenzhouxiangella sp. XN201]